MKEHGKGILEIHMLGGFTLNYNDREIVLGRSSTSKFIQLLQLVWLQGKRGIAKEQLIKNLYDRENVTNIHNSFNNLIYRMRQQMTRAGLPEGDYIYCKNGLYYADESFPVWVDVVEFENLIQSAKASEDEKEKMDYFDRAASLYRGELLPPISTETWVTMESFRYKKMYRECVIWLGTNMKKQKDYEKMFQLYTRASEIYPFDDWQVYQIDSLLCRGEYKRAYLLYDKTVRLYSDEMGLPPSKKMLECYDQMSEKLTRCPNELVEIQLELVENHREKGGAYYCSYPSFIDTYRLLGRVMERSGQSMFLMLCTLVDYEGKMIQNEEKLKKRSEALKTAIQVSLRRGDSFTRYSTSQFLILLVGTRQEDCYLIFRRISRKLKELVGPRAEITYNVTSLMAIGETVGDYGEIK